MNVGIFEGRWPTLMPEGPSIEKKILGPNIDIQWYGNIGQKDYPQILKKLHAAIVRPGTLFTTEMISQMKQAKVIVSLGVGFDQIELNTARKMNIPVCHVKNYCTEEVADSTIAMLLAHQRKITYFNHHLKWDWKSFVPIKASKQTQVGIIGLGDIGQAVVKRLKSFGYQLSYYDPHVNDVNLHRWTQVDALLENADIVTIHTPLTKDTYGMINEKFLSMMKNRSILLNTARGKIFESADVLLNFLKKRPELRIGTDAWLEEPPKPHPLISAWKNKAPWLQDRLLIYPHTAFYSENALYNLRSSAANIIEAVFAGNAPYNLVPEVL